MTWDMKDLAEALSRVGDVVSSAERYKKERDEYKTSLEQWVDYAETLEEEIKDLKKTPMGLLQQEIAELKVRSHQQRMKIEDLQEACALKAKTNRKLLAKLDDDKKEGISSRTRSKTRADQQIIDDWTKSC
jgi:chromosome segregation ATPase